MGASDTRTVELHLLRQWVRCGDLAARDELIRLLYGRLKRCAIAKLKVFPGVRRWEEAGDVLHHALIRLLPAVLTVQPASVGGLFALANRHLNWELLDRSRYYSRPAWQAAHRSGPGGGDDQHPPDWLAPAEADDTSEPEAWSAFHREVEKLPVVERAMVSLAFYHAWTQPQIAELLHVTVRTVQQRWQSARRRLRRHLAEEEAG
jgi:RNA polymerase sigma factor (sigma-70 family)